MRRGSSRFHRCLRAGLLAFVLASGSFAAASAWAQATGETPEGLAHFQAGRAHYDAQRYASALEEFRQSLAVMPSPNTRLYIARSLRELDRPAEAYAEYLHAAIEADERSAAEPRYARTAESARQEAQALLPRIALLTVSVVDPPAGATVQVDGNALDPGSWNVETPRAPGPVVVDARAPDRVPFHTTQTLSAGMQSRIEIHLSPAPSNEPVRIGPDVQPTPGHEVATDAHDVRVVAMPTTTTPPERGYGLRAAGGVVLGVGLVGLIVGATAGGLALSNYNTLYNCAHPPLDMSGQPTIPMGCPSDVPGTVQNGSTEEAIANVGLIAGGSVAAIGLGLLIAGVAQGGSDASAPMPASQARIVPVLDLAHGFVGLRGTF